ncbi:hypothetical protein FRC07_004985 [Ceratobasidium sp. 392]|nr:hypothetical protein FRC07_004985 [Ceratobasidium sp. 392]
MMMHVYILLATALVIPALAQQVNTSYLTGLLKTLDGLGLTRLVNASQSIATSSNGATLLVQLSQSSKTVFAPNNEAFSQAPSDVRNGNATALTPILSYHILDGNTSALGHLNASDFATSPNHTITRTYLNDSNLVQLEANKSQVVVAQLQRINNGEFATVGQLYSTATVSQTAAYENLIIHVDALELTNITALLESTHGITIFCLGNVGFRTVLESLGDQAQNTSVISAILANHIINGTSVYSTGFTAQSYVSTDGQEFQFSTNETGTFVTSGSAAAKIVDTDILVKNGVIHVIENATSILGQTAGGSGPTPSGSASSNASLRAVEKLPTVSTLFLVIAAGIGILNGETLIFSTL